MTIHSGSNVIEKIEKLRVEARAREAALLSVLAETRAAETEAVDPVHGAYVPLERIQPLLSDETTILQIYFAGDRVFAAILKSESLEIVPVSTVARISETLQLLRFQLRRAQFESESAQSTSANLYSSVVAHLRELHRELIAPIRSQLTARHIVVVPHGSLHCLSFHALHDGDKFLIDSHATSYAPSASVYALCHSRNEIRDGGSLVLGVPDAQAPLIAGEAEAVHRSLPNSELFLGEAASRQLFFHKAPSSRVIHVATHGSFRQDNPMFSGIRLADGYLHLWEVYQMKLSAELLALSGCATGLNLVGSGDELLGLIRGALSAGARSLLLTLWDVNDRSTTRFITSFYQHLRDSSSKAEAMVEAAKDVRSEFPHPYFWAPFILVGKVLSG